MRDPKGGSRYCHLFLAEHLVTRLIFNPLPKNLLCPVILEICNSLLEMQTNTLHWSKKERWQGGRVGGLLAVQWFRFHASTARGAHRSLVRELRSHMLQSKAKRRKTEGESILQ